MEQLVNDARAEAEAEVRDVLKTAMKAVLLRLAVDQLEIGIAGRAAEPRTPEPPPDSPNEPAPETPTACYVYAITRASWGVAPTGLAGIDRRWPLRSLVSGVSLDEFGRNALEDRLKELPWVEEKVRAHDAAVKALSAAGTVIPCRFCTILSGEGEAIDALTRHHDAIVRTLEKIDGKTEWGVKVLADTRNTAPAPQGDRDAATSTPAPNSGRSYLVQKQRGGNRREDALRGAAEAAEACHRALFAIADDAALLPTRDRGGSARGWHLALNSAYLVADEDAEKFRTRVEELAREYRPRGMRVDLTGPWPPYNFSALDLSGAPSA